MSTTDAIDADFQTTELAVRESPQALAAWTPRFVMPLEEMVQASADMTEFQRRIMVKDTHYGVIPGTDKPTLLKPGAELLLSRMALHAADPTILSETIDYGDCDADGNVTREGLIRFSLQVNIYHQTGATENERVLVGSGIGACTSREKKYRWRDGSPTCPTCGKGLRMSKQKPEWYCWAKMGGCSATFPKGDFQQVGRVPNPELGDLENTIFKMAKKRALIDATLVATGCSNVFTQDVGDDSTGDESWDTAAPPDAPKTQPAAPPRPPRPPRPPASPPIPPEARVPAAELAELARTLGIADFRGWLATQIDPELATRGLRPAESVKAKALLESLIPGDLRFADNPVVVAPDADGRMVPRTQGRLFALLDERLSTDHDERHAFAAQHGVNVASFSTLTEAQARALIRQLEMIPPPPDPDDLADMAADAVRLR